MNKSLYEIDVSNSKNETEDDLIKIRFKNEEVFQINFSKLISQSKYIREKYKYSEALDFIQSEIEEIEEKYNISEESIKLFIQFIQDQKVKIPIKYYMEIYALSEYFCIPKFIAALENINKEEMFKNLDFTIQFLLDSEKVNNGLETKLTSQIENFLCKRVNECIKNAKFRELPVSTIYRIVNQSKDKVDHNLLVDFILESADPRFVLLKIVELQKLTENKVKELIQFIDEQDENSKKMCLEYMTFNLSFIKNIIIKYDQLFVKKNQIKNELNRTKQGYNQVKQELDTTKHELDTTKQELDSTKHELDTTKQELDIIKQELVKTKQDFDQTKQKLDRIKQNFNQTTKELDRKDQDIYQTKHDLDKIKKELYLTKQELIRLKQGSEQSHEKIIFEQTNKEPASNLSKDDHDQYIIVGGFNRYNQLSEQSNNEDESGEPIIHPPLKFQFDSSSLLSYSIYCCHSVLVTVDNSLLVIGSNNDGRISATFPKTSIDNFTDFCIKDGSGLQLSPVSAVCYQYGTLYMFSQNIENKRNLVLCDKEINGGEPVFLDIGNHQPVALFGGWYHSAAIGSEGEVINPNSVKNSPDSKIEAVSLPDGEKASSIACCKDSVVVLSSNGRVFQSSIDSNRVVEFLPVEDLEDIEIVSVSGTNEHCLVVSKEGVVFARGSNECGQLGLGKEILSNSSFTKVTSLAGHEIRAAYAGGYHSLFETNEGKILSCGSNFNGELLLSSGPGKDVYSPQETMIFDGASFCIAGDFVSTVFFGEGPPPNTPNMRIK